MTKQIPQGLKRAAVIGASAILYHLTKPSPMSAPRQNWDKTKEETEKEAIDRAVETANALFPDEAADNSEPIAADDLANIVIVARSVPIFEVTAYANGGNYCSSDIQDLFKAIAKWRGIEV